MGRVARRKGNFCIIFWTSALGEGKRLSDKTTIMDIFAERFPDQIARDVEQTTIVSHPDITAFTLASVPRNCRCTISCKTEILVLCRDKMVIFIDSNNYDKIDVAVEILRGGGR
jgi:hypothetical protein